MTTKQLAERWKTERGKMIWWVAKFIIAVYCATVTTMWASTDKTLFWKRYHLASYESVHTLTSKVDSVLQISTMLLNGRLQDTYESGVRSNPKFTDIEKLEIFEGLFGSRPTITLDSLRMIIRCRNNR